MEKANILTEEQMGRWHTAEKRHSLLEHIQTLRIKTPKDKQKSHMRHGGKFNRHESKSPNKGQRE